MFNIEDTISTYGSDLVTKELELEAGYRKLGMLSTQRTYDNFESPDSHAGIGELQLGQKFIAFEFKKVQEAMTQFIDGSIAPKAGVKPGYCLILSTLATLYHYKDSKDTLSGLLTMATFSTLLTLALKKEHRNSNLSKEIVAEIYQEAKLKAFCTTYPTKAAKTLIGLDKRVQALYKRAYLQALISHSDFVYPAWPKEDSQQLGACLIQVIIKASSYFEATTSTTYDIIPSQKLLKAWSKNRSVLINASFKYCPMIIPPRPWSTFTEGGYYGELAHKAKLLRMHDTFASISKQYIKRLDQLQLSTVKKAVNAIQSTPWRINRNVLGVVKALLANGGGQAGLPYITTPPKPMVLSKTPSDQELLEYRKVMTPWYKGESRRKSLALRVLAHMRIAEQFKDCPSFYIPCNMDFRGRIYPIPSFSFQGDDLNKSLMEFADTPELTSNEQLKWLYVTGANLAGIDKVSYEDRIKWVKDNENNILESANEPLSTSWWKSQDCPLQFLAFCFAYKECKEYLKEHNGYIKGWHCGIVVAFDGTCSGLQHFSAILRDPVGGKAVNLVPQDKPNDIYAIVASKVNNVIQEDVLNGTEDKEDVDKDGNTFVKYGTKSLALLWSTFGVTRKVTKRSVMTLAYGSKEYGFKQQILEDTIKPDINSKGDKSLFTHCQSQSAKYLAHLIWQAVGTTVVAAVEGMKWLQECARIIAKEHNVVTWVTPAGLPVQQGYMEMESIVYRLRCAGKLLRLYDYRCSGNIDDRHQVSGIAPNFIHSCDASHLQITVATCYDKGIRHYSMVHDSYGTCLAHAQLMFDTVRQCFVDMYTNNDLFANFKADMEKLTDKELPEPPKKSNLDLQVVTKSDYVFC